MRAHAHCHLAHHHEGTCRTHHHEGACTLSACSPPVCIKMAKRSCLDRSVRTRASLLEQVQKPAVHMNTCSGHVMSHFYTFCFSSSIHENRHSKHNKPLIRNKQRGVAEGQIINKLIFLWSFSCFFMNWVLKRQHLKDRYLSLEKSPINGSKTGDVSLEKSPITSSNTGDLSLEKSPIIG